ncbi:MAG: NAD(P)-dependent oxidoreductase [Candidatus Micrarchaeia archaeon]
MKALVTGGGGYLGRKLIPSLQSGYTVYNLNRTPSPGSEFIRGDIREPGIDLSPYSAIFHLAAVSSPRKVDADPDEAWRINVDGTRNLCARLKKGQKLIFMSSAQVYDKSRPEPHTEDEQAAPSNFYGLTKLVGEDIVRYFARKNGFGYAILRLFNVYSADQPPGLLVGDVMEKYRRQEAIELHNPRTVLDMVHATDAVKVIGNAPSFEDGTYNVCSGHQITVGEIYRAVFEHLKAAPKEETIASDRKDFMIGDNSKLMRMGFSFRRFSL